MTQNNESPFHEAELARLNRVAGQVTGIKKMIEERRYCTDILTQLRAARSAIKSIEANILERHLGHCIAEGLNANNPDDVREKINELKDLLKRYDD